MHWKKGEKIVPMQKRMKIRFKKRANLIICSDLFKIAGEETIKYNT